MLLRLSEARLERRLLIASGAVVVATVPVAVLAYAATHGWGPLHRLDSGVATDLHSWALRAPHAVGFLKGVSKVFDPWTLRVVALGGVVLMAVRGQRRLALWAGTTVAVAGVTGFVLKLVVARSRPSLPDPVSAAPGSSFPSGHALNSMAILGVLVLLALPMVSRALASRRVGTGRRGSCACWVRARRTRGPLRQRRRGGLADWRWLGRGHGRGLRNMAPARRATSWASSQRGRRPRGVTSRGRNHGERRRNATWRRLRSRPSRRRNTSMLVCIAGHQRSDHETQPNECPARRHQAHRSDSARPGRAERFRPPPGWQSVTGRQGSPAIGSPCSEK